MKIGLSLLVSALGFACAPMVWAGLEFEKPTQQGVVKIEDSQIGTKFAFKVTGDKPVKIVDIRTFCSCVVAKTVDDRMEFKPGDTGEIEAVFEVGGFEGELKKEVLVTTDDPTAQPVRLVLEVKIPGLFEITPAQLVWMVGEKPEAKSVKIKVLGDSPVAMKAAVSSRDSMAASIREITPGKEYELVVTPASAEKRVLGLVRVETDSKYPRYQKRLVFFNITDKPVAPAPAPGAATPQTPAPPQ